jgi:hypothetical protein
MGLRIPYRTNLILIQNVTQRLDLEGSYKNGNESSGSIICFNFVLVRLLKKDSTGWRIYKNRYVSEIGSDSAFRETGQERCLPHWASLAEFFFYLVCEAIGTAATPGLSCQPRVISEDDCGEADGM